MLGLGICSFVCPWLKRKFSGGQVARSWLLLSPMVPYCQNLPDTPCSVALTIELTRYKLNRGTTGMLRD